MAMGGAVSPSDDLALLLAVLPEALARRLAALADAAELLEIVLDLGRAPEARLPGRAVALGDTPLDRSELAHIVERVGRFGRDNRAGIEATLHRISAIRNRAGEIVGLTCRVGRAVSGSIDVVRDAIETGRSVLLVGRPGVGKTTLLREAARVLADELGRRVVVVDTSNEIAGDGDVPHPGIGRSRRMQVATPADQHAVMIEAVENHMPETIVIDEIGTEAEARAARTIAERGVQLVATAHGNTLDNLLANPTLSDLLGGVEAVTLSDDEARRRGTRKTVLERRAPPTFDVLVEIQERDRFAVHTDVAEVVDRVLRGLAARPEVRLRRAEGGFEVATGESASGEEESSERGRRENVGEETSLEGALRKRQRILRLFPYAISAPRLLRAIRELRVPAYVVDRASDADLVVTLKSQERRLPKVLREAADRGRPIHVLKNGTVGQVETFLRSIFEVGETLSEQEAALREVEAAVHAVLDGGRPVELAPQGSYPRRAQHEAAAAAGLSSASRGQEPHRRVVLLPE